MPAASVFHSVWNAALQTRLQLHSTIRQRSIKLRSAIRRSDGIGLRMRSAFAQKHIDPALLANVEFVSCETIASFEMLVSNFVPVLEKLL
jgi:hypothetical protein